MKWVTNGEAIWRLVRGNNILLLVLSLCLVLYQTGIAVPTYLLGTLLLGSAAIAAGGNIINNILDQEIDQTNCPEKRVVGVVISASSAWKVYYVLNTGALLLAIGTGNKYLTACFVVAIGMLWGYSTQWKCRPWLGNIVVAFLCALSLLQLLVLEHIQWTWYWQVGVVVYASFAFLTNWLREIIKDIEDQAGDQQQGCQTLVVARGIPYSLKIALSLCNALLLWLVFQVGLLWNYQLWLALMYTSVVLIPFAGYLKYRLLQAPTKKNMQQISQWLKVYMLLGLMGFLCL